MEKETVLGKVKEALEKSSKRNFEQSVELNLNFKNIDIESPQHKLNLNVFLPKGRGRDIEIGVFADGDMNLRAKKHSKHVLNKAEIEKLAESKRKMRSFASECYGFIAQPELMGFIGKTWGVVLGTRSKMPQPAPPNADLGQLIGRIKNTVRIKSKKNPCVHVPVGTEGMSAEDIAENITAVYNAIAQKIPNDNIKSIYVKTTMGGAVRLW